MRAVRLALFFAVGLILGGGSVVAFAAAAGNAMAWVGAGGMVWKGRDGSIRSLSNPYWNGFGAAENGGVMGRLGQKAGLQGGGSLVIDIGRNIPASAIGRLGAQVARLGGPAALGLSLAPLIWDEARGWLYPPEQEREEPWDLQAGYWYAGNSAHRCGLLADQCFMDEAITERVKYICSVVWPGRTCTLQNVTMKSATQAAGTYVTNDGLVREVTVVKDAASMQCPSGMTLQGAICVGQTEPQPATDQQLADTIIFQGQQFDRMSDIAQKILEAGKENELIADAGPIQSSGAATVPGGQTTSTTTSPQGTSTTTTNVTHNVTYNSNVINITTTTTSTTVHPDGTQTTTEETATAPDGAEQEEQQYTLDYMKPQPLEVPDFYEQQYPDGFAGEWGEFRDRVAASSLAGFIGSLSNGVPAGGQCPAWSFNLNMGPMGNFGTFPLQPPCIIWPFIKTLLILTALFVARRMVVGG